MNDGPETLFQKALGPEAWSALDPAVRALHGPFEERVYVGRANVTPGESLLARFAAWFFRFPLEGGDVPVRLHKRREPWGEVWTRDFAGRRFRSTLTSAGPGRYRERFWLFTYEQDLPVVDGRLGLPVRRGWFWRLPLPRVLLAGSDSWEFGGEDGASAFDVRLLAPVTGALIVRYEGKVWPEAR